MQRRIGKFEQADRGTLFLDEIGDMPRDMRAKLLRVLEEGEVERVGGDKPLRADVRVLVATDATDVLPPGRHRRRMAGVLHDRVRELRAGDTLTQTVTTPITLQGSSLNPITMFDFWSWSIWDEGFDYFQVDSTAGDSKSVPRAFIGDQNSLVFSTGSDHTAYYFAKSALPNAGGVGSQRLT